ncbi:MAG: hypothetical protein AB3N24_21225 [Leisingera sp.]
MQLSASAGVFGRCFEMAVLRSFLNGAALVAGGSLLIGMVLLTFFCPAAVLGVRANTVTQQDL